MYKEVINDMNKEVQTTVAITNPVINSERYAGILAHPTSFPSYYGIGDLGQTSYEFVDYLKSAGQSLWQVLPLGPTGFGDSPYQGFSAFAGQPLLISPDKMAEEGLLTQTELDAYPILPTRYVDYGAVIWEKNKLFASAYERFKELVAANSGAVSMTATDAGTKGKTDTAIKGESDAAMKASLKERYNMFCKENEDWLEGYALFMALKDANEGKLWLDWDKKMRVPTAAERKALAKEHSERAGYYKMLQFLFFDQWYDLKQYANQQGIKIVGDIPIFVCLDSADVWANPELFQLEEDGFPTVVAGVPPDYFSETGQLWGNPLYDWKVHEKQGFSWWISRIKSQLKLVDIIRIDHFRGFEAYWAVKYGEDTAINGTWVDGPKEKLFLAIQKELGDNLPIWAEDLGEINEAVEKLRDTFHFPGMKILQFAFEDINDNDMMPHHHIPNCICYTGTHDNDTTVGWYKTAPKASQKKVRNYMNTGAATVSWAFIRTALGSVAKYVVIPLQDVMSLGSEARMNTPGKAAGNWSWRFEAKALDAHWAEYLKKLTRLYRR